MPPTEEMKERVLDCFSDLQVVRFSADRTEVRPGDGGALLSWEVELPTSCRGIVSLALNNLTVGRTGSRQVHPVQSMLYTLVARGAGLSATLGSVRIVVDRTGCEQSEILESDIVPQIQASVKASLNSYNNDPGTDNKVTQRRETQVEVEPAGVTVRLRLTLAINNFWDPDVNVDATLTLGISPEGGVLVAYRSFSVDVDWPWWVTGITLGITKIIEEFLDEEVEDKLKNKIRNDFQANVQAAVTTFDGVVVALETAHDRIIATTCPRS